MFRQGAKNSTAHELNTGGFAAIGSELASHVGILCLYKPLWPWLKTLAERLRMPMLQ